MYSADLTAAFDLLRKEKLVQIMREKGMPNYMIKTIHKYLEGRMGFVQMGESRSCVKDIRTGCIQGSILGPILFNIYMSDLINVVHPCKLISYADDSYIVGFGENEEEVSLLLSETAKKDTLNGWRVWEWYATCKRLN